MKPRMLIAMVAAIALSACAGSASLTARAKDEMRFGVGAAKRGYWQEALFRFEKAHELDAGDAEILNNLAVAQEALGQYDDALATYKKALEMRPGNSTIRRNYARFAEFFSSYARGTQPKGGDDATP